MNITYFDYCPTCDGKGYKDILDSKGKFMDTVPCTKCSWEPKKLNQAGLDLIDILSDMKVHMEIPSEWY